MAIPIYAMQTFLPPKILCNKIGQQIGRFFWGSTKEHQAMALRYRDFVCRPKHVGGLGFRKTHETNIVVMAKLGWQLLANNQTMGKTPK